MGTLLTMYPPQNNSPYTTLEAAIGAGETSVTVADASVLPEAPNLLTIGTDENAEVVLMTAKTGNILTVQRGIYGTTAGEWGQSERIYRAITAKDLGDLQDNVRTLKTDVEGKAAATDYSATFLASAWSGSAIPYVQTVAVPGMEESEDRPLADWDYSGATAGNFEELQENFAKILRLVPGADSLTAYCYGDKPTIDLPVTVQVVK